MLLVMFYLTVTYLFINLFIYIIFLFIYIFLAVITVWSDITITFFLYRLLVKLN